MTSFHGDQIEASPFELEMIFGIEPRVNWDSKVTMNWTLETESGQVFTVYDWKYYRKIDLHETIIWNIGGHRKEATAEAREEISQSLKALRVEWVQIQ